MANLSRLRKFRDFIAQIPPRAIDMDDVVTKTPQKQATLGRCGAVACGIGWIALAPELKSFGLSVAPIDDYDLQSWVQSERDCGIEPTLDQIRAHSYDTSVLLFKGEKFDAYDYATIGGKIFGIDRTTSAALFDPKGASDFDERFTDSKVDKMSHKAILLSRLDHLIANHKDHDALWATR